MSQLTAPHSLGRLVTSGLSRPYDQLWSHCLHVVALYCHQGAVSQTTGLWVIVGSLVCCKEGKNQSRQRTEVCLSHFTIRLMHSFIFVCLCVPVFIDELHRSYTLSVSKRTQH